MGLIEATMFDFTSKNATPICIEDHVFMLKLTYYTLISMLVVLILTLF